MDYRELCHKLVNLIKNLLFCFSPQHNIFDYDLLVAVISHPIIFKRRFYICTFSLAFQQWKFYLRISFVSFKTEDCQDPLNLFSLLWLKKHQINLQLTSVLIQSFHDLFMTSSKMDVKIFIRAWIVWAKVCFFCLVFGWMLLSKSDCIMLFGVSL